MHPDDVERTRRAIDASIASRVLRHQVPDAAARGGQRLPVGARDRPRRVCPDGTPVRFDGVTVDITAQRKAKRCCASARPTSGMADHAPAMLWVTDASGNATYLSKQWYQYTGGHASKRNWALAGLQDVHPDDRQATQDVFLGAHARRIPFAIDYRLRRHDGQYRWAVDAGVPRFTGRENSTASSGPSSTCTTASRRTGTGGRRSTERRIPRHTRARVAHPLAPLLTAVHSHSARGADPRMRDRALPIMERQVTQLYASWTTSSTCRGSRAAS